MSQTYQDVTLRIKVELKRLKFEEHVHKLDGFDVHSHFYKLKQERPEDFEKLWFVENWGTQYSETLDQILQDLRVCGFLRVDYDVINIW